MSQSDHSQMLLRLTASIGRPIPQFANRGSEALPMKRKKPKMTPRMARLLALLRRIESERPNITERDFEELARTEAGYKEIKTYRSKYLDDTLMFHREDDPVSLVVRGAVAITEDGFAQLLSQRKSGPYLPGHGTEEDWRKVMRTLAAEGARRSFRIATGDEELLAQLLPPHSEPAR